MTNSKCKSNQSGFSTLSALFLIPFLVLILWVACQFLAIIQKQQNTVHHCRVGLLNAQKAAAKAIDQITQLNSKVYQLSAEFKFAKVALGSAIASGQAAAILAARIWYNRVQAERTIVKMKQKSILLTAYQKMNSHIWHERLTLDSENSDNLLFKFEHADEKLPRPYLAIRPKYIDEGPPVYETQEPIDKNQVFEWRWLEDWSFLKTNYQMQWRKKCRATLQRENNQLQAKLIADKF